MPKKIVDVVNCLGCGAPIERAQYQIDRNRRYCSRKCGIQGTIKNPDKPCEHCKILFKPHDEATRYCSHACRSAASDVKIEKACPQCGAKFKTYPSTDATYCSSACSYAAKAGKPRKGDTVDCKHCLKPFYRLPCEIERNRVFCSRTCHSVALVKAKIVKHCEECGAEMTLHQSQVSKRFCTKKCDGLYRTKEAGKLFSAIKHNGKQVRISNDGYVLLWEPERFKGQKHKWIRQHRLVMEQHLGRHLGVHEDVHHKDGNKVNNSIDNLELMNHKEHMAMHRHPMFKRIKDELKKYQDKYGIL